jgi:xanthine dehydrogenase/oxidase
MTTEKCKNFLTITAAVSTKPAYLTTGSLSSGYESEIFDVIAKKGKTDAPSNTWCRAPGTVEGISMIENIMEDIAWKVNKDPVEVLMNNISGDSGMKKLLPEFVESVGEFYDLEV